MEKTHNTLNTLPNRYYIISYFKGQDIDKRDELGDVFLREEYIELFAKSGKEIKQIRFSSNIERIVYAEQLLSKNVKIQNIPLPDIKFSSAIKEMMSIKREGYDTYMKKGIDYMLDSTNERVIKDSGISYIVDDFKFFSEKGNAFILSTVFPNKPEYTPYLMRLKNFFQDRNYLLFTPKENISPVFKDDNLDQLFILLGMYKPRFESGKVYLLKDVGIMGDAVYIQYGQWDSREDMLFRVAYGLDSWTGRTKDDIKNFFEKYKGYYFVTAEDIYDNMLDYMKVPSNSEPFPFYFEKIYWIDDEKAKELFNMTKSDIGKWNEIKSRSFFKPVSNKFFAQCIL
jgi:hypothetical protein